MMSSKAVNQAYQNRPKPWKFQLFINTAIIILFLWSVQIVKPMPISEHGAVIARNIIRGIINPNFNIVFSMKPYHIPYMLLETLSIAFLGTLIASILSFILAILGAKNLGGKYGFFIVQPTITFIRTTPVLLFAMIFVLTVGPGPFAGVLAIGINTTGVLTRMFIEIIEDIDMTPIESLDAIGATTIQKLSFAYIPMVFSQLLSSAIYRLDINVRSSSTLGIVGAGGIGFLLTISINFFDWRSVGSVIWSMLLMVLILELISTKLRKKAE